MSNKITSHPRFINKMIQDLKKFYYGEDFNAFIQLFQEFIQMNPKTHDIEIIDMYYESLFSLNNYEAARRFAEISFQHKQMSSEESELHLKMVLKSLDALKQYDELLGWAEVIINAGDSERVAPSVYNKAKMYRNKAMQYIETHGISDGQKNNQDTTESSIINEIDIEQSLNSNDAFLKVQALETLIEKQDDSYAQKVFEMFNSSNDTLLKSMMVIYLKVVEFQDAPIHFNKFGYKFKKYTKEFKVFEKEAKVDKTIDWIIEIGNVRLDGNESRIEQTIELFLNISILWYPLKVSFTPKELAEGFVSYAKVLNNELSTHNFYGEVSEWIMMIESQMNE